MTHYVFLIYPNFFKVIFYSDDDRHLLDLCIQSLKYIAVIQFLVFPSYKTFNVTIDVFVVCSIIIPATWTAFCSDTQGYNLSVFIPFKSITLNLLNFLKKRVFNISLSRNSILFHINLLGFIRNAIMRFHIEGIFLEYGLNSFFWNCNSWYERSPCMRRCNSSLY